jgi:hypothetical protein
VLPKQLEIKDTSNWPSCWLQLEKPSGLAISPLLPGKKRPVSAAQGVRNAQGPPLLPVRKRHLPADIVAKVAERTLWNRNLKQSNRDVRAFESMLRIRARS